MSTLAFYEELKQLREQQNIELTEISNRTKINLQFLEAIESGDFTFLPHVYVRLFLRAYALEIGADPDDILNQFELFLSTSGEELPERHKIELESEITFEDTEVEIEEEVPTKTPFQTRSDWIKASILVGILIFAIFIIQKITSPQNTSLPISSPKHLQITDELLSLEYTRSIQTTPTKIDSPFFFSLQASAPVWYQYSIDKATPISSDLVKGGEIIMDFKSSLELRLNHTENVKFKINDHPIPIENEGFPIDLSFTPDQKEIQIIRYLPK